MKYIVLILVTLLTAVSGVGYWYYDKTETRIATLRDNNTKLESAVELNEQAISDLQSSYADAQRQMELLNQENIRIRRNNDRLVEKFGDSDIATAAAARPELIERLINRGTDNAFRCLELLSGAELTERERNAENERHER
jgi:cell division protein FtsB